MIIEHNFASDLLEKIDDIIYTYYEKHSIEVKDISYRTINELDWLKKTQNYSMPIHTVGSTDVLFITRSYYKLMAQIWEKDHPELIKGGIEETINSNIKSDFPDECIQSAIHDKIHRLVFEYDKVLNATKETNCLFGINDEEKILKIHLNKYLEVLNSDLLQIDFLFGIKLNKEISDLILEIYIRFINLRLRMLNPEIQTDYEIARGKSKKILWNGTQKDLLELFVELQNKGWINQFHWGDTKKNAHSICNLFDLTLTQKKKDSNVEESFYQILKGVRNQKTGERDYTELLAPKSKRRFDQIKKCS